MDHTVVTSTVQAVAERHERNVLNAQTAIALLAVAHMREMVAEGWVMQRDGHGSTILVKPVR